MTIYLQETTMVTRIEGKGEDRDKTTADQVRFFLLFFGFYLCNFVFIFFLKNG
jgi:hypothetical protein